MEFDYHYWLVSNGCSLMHLHQMLTQFIATNKRFRTNETFEGFSSFLLFFRSMRFEMRSHIVSLGKFLSTDLTFEGAIACKNGTKKINHFIEHWRKRLETIVLPFTRMRTGMPGHMWCRSIEKKRTDKRIALQYETQNA